MDIIHFIWRGQLNMSLFFLKGLNNKYYGATKRWVMHKIIIKFIICSLLNIIIVVLFC